MISAVFFFNIITDWGLLWGSLIPAIGLHQSERGNVRIFLKSFFFLEINDQKHQECLWCCENCHGKEQSLCIYWPVSNQCSLSNMHPDSMNNGFLDASRGNRKG